MSGVVVALRTRFAGAEDGSRDLQFLLNLLCERVRPSKYTPGDPICIVERRDGLTEIEIVERGAVLVERPRIIPTQPERGVITLSKNASRHGDQFAEHRLAFFEALEVIKGIRVVVGC